MGCFRAKSRILGRQKGPPGSFNKSPNLEIRKSATLIFRTSLRSLFDEHGRVPNPYSKNGGGGREMLARGHSIYYRYLSIFAFEHCSSMPAVRVARRGQLALRAREGPRGPVACKAP